MAPPIRQPGAIFDPRWRTGSGTAAVRLVAHSHPTPLMRRLTTTFALALLAAAFAAAPADAQYYNQDRLAELLYSQRDSLDFLPEVTFRYWVLEHETNNSIYARHVLYQAMGDGDVDLGRERVPFLEFLTRQRIDRLSIGDTIVLPEPLGLDLRAYGPFPRFYPASEEIGKIVVLHKKVQAWAAYEYGRLMRWGLVNTGRVGYETPGAVQLQLAHLERISSESPPGESGSCAT
jgi:hypothetical protein